MAAVNLKFDLSSSLKKWKSGAPLASTSEPSTQSPNQKQANKPTHDSNLGEKVGPAQSLIIKRLCLGLIIFGILMKLYGLNAPWKRHDHYNFGGIVTSAYAECLKSTPLNISKGVPHFLCWTNAPVYYRAHPPSILFALWGWTSLFGSEEWSYRLFIAFFSTLNIGLIFLIGREVRRGVFPWMAAAFQAIFLGNMYFATHLDFIGEFTVFFVLLMALTALKRRMTLAGGLALLAGISAWPGYIAFGPLWLYALLIRRGRKRIFFMAVAGFGCALVTMMWLHQTSDIFEFLHKKLLDPGYIRAREKGWSEPFRFILNFLTSQSRLLSPLFAALAFWELAFGSGRATFSSWKSRWSNLEPFHHALLLSGGTGLFYALIGHEYFMVHVYLYLLFTPALALLCARFTERVFTTNGITAQAGDGKNNVEPGGGKNKVEPGTANSTPLITKISMRQLAALSILFTAVYPFGIFKTNAIHDALTSLALAGAALALGHFAWRGRISAVHFLVMVGATATANASQLMNYRNEPDTERSFCEKARAEFARTGQPVETHEERSNAKDLMYCKGIPIRYLDSTGKELTP